MVDGLVRLVRGPRERQALDYLLAHADPEASLPDRVAWLTELMRWIRLHRAEKTAAPKEDALPTGDPSTAAGDPATEEALSGSTHRVRAARVRFLLQLLDRHPDWKRALAETLRSILRDAHGLRLFAATGLPQEYGFWSEATRIIEVHPILGSGLNTYAKMATQFGYAHNCYLQMAAEIGILGLIVFLVMLGFLYGGAVQALPYIRDPFIVAVTTGAMAGLFGFLTQSFLDTTFYSVQLSNLMWIFMGLIVAAYRLGRVQNN